MVRLSLPLRYLSDLTPGKIMLWCYFIWYLVTVAAHFDPSLRLWLSSLGVPVSSNRWQTFRLFLMPFCVSSFSALIKGHGHVLVLPARPLELGLSVSLCAIFVLFVLGLKLTQRGVRA